MRKCIDFYHMQLLNNSTYCAGLLKNKHLQNVKVIGNFEVFPKQRSNLFLSFSLALGH